MNVSLCLSMRLYAPLCDDSNIVLTHIPMSVCSRRESRLFRIEVCSLVF